jgi:hypothetical protein
MGIRLVLNASLPYGRCVKCGVPESGGADTGVGGCQLPRTHMPGPSHVLGKMLGSTDVHCGAGSHCALYLKSADTTLNFFDLCFLNSFCFVF